MTVCCSCTIKDEDLYIADDTMTLHWSFRQEMQCCGFNLSRMTTNTEIEIYSRHEIVTDHILSSESNRLRLLIIKFGLNYQKVPCVRPFDTYLLPDKIFSGCVPAHKLIYHVGDIWCIYGPIDGLLLLEKGNYIDDGRFGWWNPATKECRLIPHVFFEVEEGLEDNDRRIGIGIDLATHDYKIIWVRTYWNDYESDIFPKVYAAVYSTKNNSWKHLDPNFSHECQICSSHNCTYKNGTYYWISTSKKCIAEGINVYFIRTFDFSTDLFGRFEGPPIPGEHWVTLFLRGGSIATMSSKDVTQAMVAFYDIWVNIQGNHWIKVYTVNPPITDHTCIGMWEYDKFIYELTQSCKVLFYDQTSKQVTSLGFDFVDLGFGSCWALSYKESLFPIRKEKPGEKDNIDYFMVDY
uniref:F-box associated beta-propeller type 1 domain-containing protein n=1 Tax=Solanum lycopersicum TaxID=4081 RepID=A0A3Q7GWZ9_SOLLC